MHCLRKVFVPWFSLSLILVFVHQVIEKCFHIHFRVLDNYLDPLLAMPIILHSLLWEKRILFRKGLTYTFSSLHLILYFITFSIIFEYLFPKWSLGFTADIWDVVCYGAGTFLFAAFFNKPYLQYHSS